MVAINGMNEHILSSTSRQTGLVWQACNPLEEENAANEAKGIILKNWGILNAQINKRKPWMMAEYFDFPPDWILAELRTITCVIGRPPINPEMMLPIPCAFNSLLVGVAKCSGSSLSVASTHKRVSRLATIHNTKAVVMIG